MFQNYIAVIETDPNDAITEALERTECTAGGAKIVNISEITDSVNNYTIKILPRYDSPEPFVEHDWE